MALKELSHQQLDARLNPSAGDPGRFESIAAQLCAELDARGTNFAFADPETWRRRGNPLSPRAGVQAQFRAEVENILPLDREEEGRLARRIEFARKRFERARAAAGDRAEQLLSGVEVEFDEWIGDFARRTRATGLVRRWLELHALRAEMVERNLYLVLINVERYAHIGASRTDLIQEGCVSLFRAVDGFDWRRGLLFRTYAVHWLNQAFRNYLYNFGNTVRVPVYLQKALKHINQAQIRLGDPNASAGEIAETAELTESLVTAAIAASRASYSIDMALSDDDQGTRLRDLLVVDEAEGPYSTRLEQVSLEEGLGRALGKLSKRESLVLEMRFGLGREREHTLAEVADELGVSVERVRQIQVRALSKLNTPGLRRELDPWLN